MTALRDWLERLDRIQNARAFKIGASIAVLLLGAVLLGAYAVAVNAPTAPAPPAPPAAGTPAPEAHDADADRADAAVAPAPTPEELEARSAAEATSQAIRDVLATRAGTGTVGVGIAAGVALAVLVIWLGLGLTYLALAVLVASLALPVHALAVPSWRGAAVFIAGTGLLAAAFAALMQGLRLAFAGSTPVLAVARNVVAEAVRMKISLVFIVVLVFGLAALPGLLDPASPLRYRVQSFLQYGIGGSFLIIAVLVLFLAVGSVAFEQRDRTIWQTITKPVTTWQYLLGKWLGVVGVAGALLCVSTVGIFLFTEYLRAQVAVGEIAPYTPVPGRAISDDRLALETQVLAARSSVRPSLPPIDEEAARAELARRVEAEVAAQLTPEDQDAARRRLATPEEQRRLRDELDRQFLQDLLSIEPGTGQAYIFEGLGRARALARPVTLRYRVNAGSNDPTQVYRVTFYVPGGAPFVKESFLNQTLTIPLSPAAISEDGTLELRVFNGDVQRRTANERTMTFPPDGLEILYPVSSFHANYLRAVGVLWLKLAFLAMIGITAATFLSFPVACLVAFGLFAMAEGADFLSSSLETYDAKDIDGAPVYYKMLIRAIAVPIASVFRHYAGLAPTTSLVEGRLVGWDVLGAAGLVLGLVSALLFVAGGAIFRRRELALYSGHG